MGPQGRSGLVWKISSPPGFDPRDRSSRGESLHRSTLRKWCWMNCTSKTPRKKMHLNDGVVKRMTVWKTGVAKCVQMGYRGNSANFSRDSAFALDFVNTLSPPPSVTGPSLLSVALLSNRLYEMTVWGLLQLHNNTALHSAIISSWPLAYVWR
jgi:hypothetical protein